MEVRQVRPEEFDAVGELTVAAYRLLRENVPLGDYEEELRDVAARAADSIVLVAVEGSSPSGADPTDGAAVLGSVTYVPDPNRNMSEFTDPAAAGIRMLAVDPAVQGRGAGRLLTETCIERARSEGKQRVFLHSTAPMAVARGMYERIGFERREELDEFYADPPFTEASPLHLIAYSLELGSLGDRSQPPGSVSSRA